MIWIILALQTAVIPVKNYIDAVEEKKNTEFMVNFLRKQQLKTENRRQEAIANVPSLKDLDLE